MNISNKPNERKTIDFVLNNLGAAKQAPMLVEEICKALPDSKINIIGTRIDINIIKKMMTEYQERKDIRLSGINYFSKKSEVKYPDIEIELAVKLADKKFNLTAENERLTEYSSQEYAINTIYGRKLVRFWVDPLKFEPRPLLDKKMQKELKRKYDLENAFVYIAGSTTIDESALFVDAVNYVKNNTKKNIKGIIVPRHFPHEIENMLEQDGLSYTTDKRLQPSKDFIVIKQSGILDDLYSICDIALIGGTFDSQGLGQNPLEPAMYGKPIVSGEYWKNNSNAYEGLKRSGLLEVVDNEKMLGKIFLKKLNEPVNKIYQDQAADFIKSQQGAAKRYANVVKKNL